MGSDRRLKIAILTSSRADFGIYLPLLKELKARSEEFDLEIIAFGTHLSRFHGYTLDVILDEGFEVAHQIPSMLLTDNEESIATAYALTALKFSEFWSKNKNKYNWVLCLGDRYEMAAAVVSGIPFGIRFAHIGGGDTTLGAIDDIYRHSITLASSLHFVALEPFALRVKQLAGENARCVITGSLSLDNLEGLQHLTKGEFSKKWGIDFNSSTILVTIHPETVKSHQNEFYCEEAVKALRNLGQQSILVITMPNADTSGSIFRQAFERLKREMPGRIILIENFGSQAYFTCMKYADFLLGNTSSGIVEAASFGKFVVNIGERQKGRIAGENIIHVEFDSDLIVEAAEKVKGKVFTGRNIYSRGNATQLMINELQKLWI